MSKILIATNNLGKQKEIASLLREFDPDLTTPNALGLHLEVEEDGSTYQENAFKKAVAFAQASGLISLADDTGLEVEALNGEPGVFSARYAGEEKNAQANMNKVLHKLAKIKNRNARFRTVISLIIKGEEKQFEGIVEGEIIKDKRGAAGFGYDPVFQPKGFKETFAEMNLEDKNKISHRGRAVQELIQHLQTL